VFEVCLASHEIVISEDILREVRRHLGTRFRLPSRQADAVLSFLREHATMVRPAKVPSGACRDRTDLPVLGTALAAGADCLVTGDRDLLDLGTFHEIQVLSPRALHDRLR